MHIVYVEPFEGGSHASFTRTLTSALEARWTKLTLPGRHWKWRMRGCAAWAVLEHAGAFEPAPDLVFASSYVPLAELVGLVPALASVPRVLYFHENQLAYPQAPDRSESAVLRDQHFGFTQLVSGLAADRCVFNSAFNRDSFLGEGRAWLSRMPDARPRGWIERLAQRSVVLPVPVELGNVAGRGEPPDRSLGPLIVWNHRWEHDKNPEDFFSALFRLDDDGVPFQVAVLGQAYSRRPEIFATAQSRLGSRIVQFGPAQTRSEYEHWLARADLAVSTARHEFFGISMIEAAHFGARPLVPDRLSYPEIFSVEHRYADREDLVRRLRQLCRAYAIGRDIRMPDARMAERFGAQSVVPRFRRLFESLCGAGA